MFLVFTVKINHIYYYCSKIEHKFMCYKINQKWWYL